MLEDSPAGHDLLQQLDRALEIERGLESLNGRDPWDPVRTREIYWLEGLMGYFLRPVLEGRGWQQALSARKQGITAWDALRSDWLYFRGSFDGDDTGFHRNPDVWEGFIRHLETWCTALQRTLPQLCWTLPGARQSHPWIELRDAWQNSEEGRLWQASGAEAPEDLSHLYDIYNEVLQQIEAFARLHAELLAVIPHYVSDPDEMFLSQVRGPLTQLHQVRPLSKPVREIKKHLTNPQVNINIGSVYQRLYRDKHHEQ